MRQPEGKALGVWQRLLLKTTGDNMVGAVILDFPFNRSEPAQPQDSAANPTAADG